MGGGVWSLGYMLCNCTARLILLASSVLLFQKETFLSSPSRRLTLCNLSVTSLVPKLYLAARKWTHGTLSMGLIISILETVIYEFLTSFDFLFTLGKAKNIVIICDVLKTLVTNWSQMPINVKCFGELSFGSLTGLEWHYPSASSSDNCSSQIGANLVIMVLIDLYVSLHWTLCTYKGYCRPGVRRLGSRFAAMWPWANQLTFFSFHFLIQNKWLRWDNL